jgi:hypothetical protein
MSLGTGGQIGTLESEMTSLGTSLGDITGTGVDSPLSIQGAVGPDAVGIGGLLGPAVIAQQTLEQQIAGLSPGSLETALAAAEASAAGSSTTNTTETGLLQQLLTTTAQELAVSQDQYAVLSQLPPFGGSFASGGIVPGPVGMASTVIAHGGEVISPPGGGGPHVWHVIVQDGAVDKNKIRVIAADEVQKGTRTMARDGTRGLPGAGGGLTRTRYRSSS